MWYQPLLWCSSFFIWYHLFCTAFLPFLAPISWYFIVILHNVYVLLMFLTLGSLFQALYAPPHKFPESYLIPSDFLHAPKNKQGKWENPQILVRDLAKQRKLGNFRSTVITYGKKQISVPLYCLNCSLIKAPKTRHCTRCDACLYRMDHHCPALGKCVHSANQKHFMVFLVYSVLICSYTDLAATYYVFQMVIEYLFNPHDILLIPLTFAFTGLLQTLTFPPILIWFQYGLWEGVFEGSLTIESIYEEEEGPRPKEQVDYYNNFKEVFGEDKWKWWLPLHVDLDISSFDE